jgi:thiamine-phosphate pyrophosphorylase
MKPSKAAYQLYAITAPHANLMDQVRAAIAGGITMLQIREKNCTTKRLIELAYPIVTLCKSAGVPCLINDDVEAARVLGADGVHVGQKDMKLKKAREILGENAIIGTSAHNLKEAIKAQEEGADYIGCGALFRTGTKSDATPLAIDTLKEIRAAVSIPVVAIGGITPENLPNLYHTGIDGIAVVSSIFGQPDVKKATENLIAMTTGTLCKETP